MLPLGHRPRPALRSPKLLPSSPRQDPILLHRLLPPEDRHLVLHRRYHPELLVVGTLRPQLALPLELNARTSLGHRAPHPHLLRRRLGPHAVYSRPSEQTARVDPPHLCHRSRCPAMGANAMGHQRHRYLCPLRLGGFWSYPWPCVVVLALGARQYPRRGFRHDPVADVDAVPCGVYASVRASHRVLGDDCVAGQRAGCDGAGECVPEFCAGGVDGIEAPLVLDWVDVPVGDPGGVLCIF